MPCSLMMAGSMGRETQCDGRGDTVGDTVGDTAWWGEGAQHGQSVTQCGTQHGARGAQWGTQHGGRMTQCETQHGGRGAQWGTQHGGRMTQCETQHGRRGTQWKTNGVGEGGHRIQTTYHGVNRDQPLTTCMHHGTQTVAICICIEFPADTLNPTHITAPMHSVTICVCGNWSGS